MGPAESDKILEQPWWTYITVSMGFFLVCLALNYAVKKLNEARMGERLIRVLEKSSLPQCTHVNGPVITVPSEGEPRTISVKAPQAYSPPAISLIFDKEENKRIGDVYNMIKPVTDWTHGDPSLNSERSLETTNVLPISSDHTIDESSPIKKIECELVTAKATSSRTFSEKVVIKDKIDSYDLITPKNYRYSEIPGIAGCNTNSVTAKEPRRIIIGGTSPTELKNTVAENNSFSNICDVRMVPTNNYIVENTMKNTKVIKDKKSREKIDTGCLDSIMAKIANLKNMDDNPRIEKRPTNTIIAKSSSSHNEIKITSIERQESTCIASKESSHTHYNHIGENIPVKTSKSEQIVPKETSFDAQNESRVREYVSIRNNVIMNSSSNERSHYNVTESVPFKNTECGPVPAKASHMDKIGAGRIFPTNVSFTEIAVKDPKVMRDKKSNEEIDTSCLDDLKSKATIFKNIHDDTRIEKSATLSNRNITKINSVEKMESKDILPDTQFKRIVREYARIRNSIKNECRLIELKKTSSNEQSSPNVTEYVPIKTSEPRRIVARQTALLTRSDTNVTVLSHALENPAGRAEATPSHTQSPIRKSEFGFLVAEETSNNQRDDNVKGTNIATPPNTQSEITVSKDSSIKKTQSGCVNVKETSNRQTEINVPDTDIVQMDFADEEKSITTKEIYTRKSEASAVKKGSLRELVSANNATEYVIIKTSEPGRIVARQTALLTRSDTNVTVLSHALENAHGHIVAEATSSHTQSPIRKSEFGFLAAEETSNNQRDDNVPGTNIATPPNTQSEITVSKDGSIKKTESGSINVKETSNRRTEINVPDTDIVQIDFADEEKTLRKLVLANNATEYSIQTSGSGSIVDRETALRTPSGSDFLNSIEMSESGSISDKAIYNRQNEASAVKEESLRELVSANNATEYVIIKTSGSGSIVARETASLTLGGPDVWDPIKIKMSESGSIVLKEISKRQREDNVPDTSVIKMDGSESDPDVHLAEKKL